MQCLTQSPLRIFLIFSLSLINKILNCMKKITTLLFITLICLGNKAFAQFPEDFSGTTVPTGWAIFDNGIGTTNSWSLNNGATAGYMYSQFETQTGIIPTEDYLVTPQFTVDATNNTLTFLTTNYYPDDFGSSLMVKVSTASQTTIADFTTVATYSEAEIGLSWTTHYVDLSAYIGMPIYVAFVHEQLDGDVIFLDDVNMMALASNPPGIASTPTPIDGAVNVGLTYNETGGTYSQVTFSWTAPTTGDPVDYYELNLGTSPTDLSALNTSTTSTTYNIYGFSDYTTYYWQIVPVNSAGPATGSPVWSFTTGTALSTETIEQSLAFQVYPNPVKNIMNIKTNEVLVSAEVYNQMGQKMLSADQSVLSNNTLDLSELKTGIYIVKVTGESNSQSFTITKE